jgi:predicted nucleotidyltransferase
MNPEIKILKLLLNNKEEIFTIKKIAERTEINYRIAYEKIKLLEKEALVRVTKTGNTKVCKFTNKFNDKVFKAEYERRQELFRKNKDFKVLYRRLFELQFPFIALLFGSHTKGKATKHSDIDLLIICEEKREHQIQEIFDLFPLKIHPSFTRFGDFIKMLKTKEFSVVTEAVKNNIILIGIEDYYRLIENAE